MNVLRHDLQKLAALAESRAPAADPWRPGFHLAPPVGFLNDPNGLCRFRGEYHVFYQYAPFDPEGRSVRFWGHYKSRDLLNWEPCPVMLCPDEPFDLHGVYSGSALCGDDGLYLYYTGNVKHQEGDYVRTGRESSTVLAYSPDGVRLAWKRPLMRNGDYPAGLTLHVRDPKVWEQDGRYYMVQGARTREDRGEVLVFESPDKVHWTHINTLRAAEPLGYMWECPDLFEIDGQWVLLACPQGAERRGPGFENRYACGYFPLSGDFRGDCALGEFVPLDFGFDFYAPQTFQDGKRRLLCAWMGMPDAEYTNPTVEHGWQHCLTVFRELRFRDGRLRMLPVKELESLEEHTEVCRFSGERTVTPPRLADLRITCEGALSLELSGLRLEYAAGNLVLTIPEGGYGRDSRSVPIRELRNLRLLVDTSAVEIFANDGEAVLTSRWYPRESRLTLRGEGQAVIRGLRPMRVEKL